MKQLSRTVILTRHHLTPLANMDMKGSDHLQCVKCHGSHQQGRRVMSVQFLQEHCVGFQLPVEGKCETLVSRSGEVWECEDTDTEAHASFREAEHKQFSSLGTSMESQCLFSNLCPLASPETTGRFFSACIKYLLITYQFCCAPLAVIQKEAVKPTGI